MNERIKELMDQAWTIVSDEERNNGKLYEADRQRERRDQVFAELIVRECSAVARQADIDGCNIGNYAWEKIKEHFGVEE